jgi:hypothetical protein
MARYMFETPYDIQVSELRITRPPIIAILKFTSGEVSHVLRFTNPRPVSATTRAFDGDCYQIRIGDRNDDGMQLEFGRYNVELWDEDNPVAQFTVDDFEHDPVDLLT